MEYLLDVDPVLRLRAVTALNKLRQQNGDRRLEHELVETVLAAEILGHYRSYQLLSRLPEHGAASDPALAPFCALYVTSLGLEYPEMVGAPLLTSLIVRDGLKEAPSARVGNVVFAAGIVTSARAGKVVGSAPI